jgi:RsiW-degrading membrane proteinase PrsW (M82 family)
MAYGSRPRIFHDSPVTNPQVARFLTIILALLLQISVWVVVKSEILSLSPEASGIFLKGLLLSCLLSIIPLLVLIFLDRRERESPWVFAVMLLWGALIAAGISKPLNHLLSTDDRYLAILPQDIQRLLLEHSSQVFSVIVSVPVVEAFAKGLGVLLVFWLLRSEFNGVRDGFIYGALVGIGFNLQESAFYLADGYGRTGSAPWGMYFTIYHSLLGLGGHALYTGVFGMGLGLARQSTRRWLRWTAPPISWLLALAASIIGKVMGLLSVFIVSLVISEGLGVRQGLAGLSPADSAFWLAIVTASYVSIFWSTPFLALVAVLLWQSGSWERRVIREQLADELEPVITRLEYEGVIHDRILRTRRIPNLTRRESAAIVTAQNKLAIRKWQVRHLGGDPAADPLVSAWRQDLAVLREQSVSITAV